MITYWVLALVVNSVWINLEVYSTKFECELASEQIELQLIEKTGTSEWWKCTETDMTRTKIYEW